MVKYIWTHHARHKMSYYKLSENRIKRVIRAPIRIEEGIAPSTIAVMQPTSYTSYGTNKKWNQEIWVMYVLDKKNKSKKDLFNQDNIKVISAWRYPGVTKPREKLPEEIKEEIKEALLSI